MRAQENNASQHTAELANASAHASRIGVLSPKHSAILCTSGFDLGSASADSYVACATPNRKRRTFGCRMRCLRRSTYTCGVKIRPHSRIADSGRFDFDGPTTSHLPSRPDRSRRRSSAWPQLKHQARRDISYACTCTPANTDITFVPRLSLLQGRSASETMPWKILRPAKARPLMSSFAARTWMPGTSLASRVGRSNTNDTHETGSLTSPRWSMELRATACAGRTPEGYAPAPRWSPQRRTERVARI